MTDTVQTEAPKILEIIKSSKNILLHCHPSPDPDSLGSSFAMKFALEQLGKTVTVIAGDSVIPEAFMHFPGATSIVPKNFFEIDLTGASGSLPFDLFIIQDAGSPEMISRKQPLVPGQAFPASLKTIIIDHHVTNTKFAKDVNLVDTTYPATCQILYDLFTLWGIRITPEIAGNLFIGMFTDTGGFRYSSTIPATLEAAATLTKIYPDFSTLISKMENSKRPLALTFQGVAFSNIETFPLPDGAHVAIASVPNEIVSAKGFDAEDMSSSMVASVMRGVVGYDIAVCITEIEPNKVKGSMRKRDGTSYDLSLIAAALGGGGHKAAAGLVATGTIAEVKKRIVDEISRYVTINAK